MAAVTLATNTEAAIWKRVIHFENDLSPTAARALLKVRFSSSDQDRMAVLSAKARSGSLTPDEQNETDAFERLGCMLDILHSQARRALKRRKAS